MDLRTCWRKTPGLPVGFDVGVRDEEGPKFGAWISRVGRGLPTRHQGLSLPPYLGRLRGPKGGDGAVQGCAGHFSPAAMSCSPGLPDLSERL